ncbi:hypothetical protein SAMN05444141_102650 [Pseudovibrio denitrificans]|uniref:Uncharacterized protein n=1 Tax=Pseudovibrio denitrificans TaxID=258256 RepID=A0A1I6ZVZ2_9HYPH|nr:hypothetical protein [Pseudovibrio denitrificans]SFT66868.1 hypothetical protein SAMN05444141_102650 [Pseudovibrio denitrificans]
MSYFSVSIDHATIASDLASSSDDCANFIAELGYQLSEKDPEILKGFCESLVEDLEESEDGKTLMRALVEAWQEASS